MNYYYFDSFKTSFGTFSVAVDENGAVAATAFGDRTVLLSRLGDFHLIKDKTRAAPVREQVLAYCTGQSCDFDLPLAAAGTAFQNRVWTALRKIPLGATRSYGDLARALGNPGASRAIGRANATNPICLIIPCHRVIGADGSLTGFAFGEDIKRRLLDHERALATSRAA